MRVETRPSITREGGLGLIQQDFLAGSGVLQRPINHLAPRLANVRALWRKNWATELLRGNGVGSRHAAPCAPGYVRS